MKTIKQIERQAFGLLLSENCDRPRARKIIDIRNRYCANIEKFWHCVNYDFVRNAQTSRTIYRGY